MASRISWPTPQDPNAHKEEDWTLSRTATEQRAIKKSGIQPGDGSASNEIHSPGPQNHGVPLRHRFVFTDPVAFRYLEEDPTCTVLQRKGVLKGYELYLVEQWACSRIHPTFVITTYTGDSSHQVLVGILGVPADEDKWSPRLRVYFKAISQYHARPKETPLGMLMVTNLSGFPSALTVIPVPDGDVRKHREDFIVNENLKRLGCSGRSGLSLSQPTGATQAKFHQLYRTSERIPLYGSVIELIKLCQVALMVFGMLEQEYADGLMCDVTEKAINDWWTKIGSEYYNTEPSDGILGPTTVAALLGLLIGARNRLNYLGAPVAKDAFDIASLKRGIAYFQKSQKLDRTRRLDRQTLNKLHSVTAKAAANEGWAVPKAVKSTVAELSGKGGEMVMGMVGGGKEKAAIGDIETLDLDHFVDLIHGERSKWLWYGKARRSGNIDPNLGKSLPGSNMIFGRDDHGGFTWSNKRHDSIIAPEVEREIIKREGGVYSAQPASSAVSLLESGGEKDPQLRKAVFKSVTGKMSDARSGFGRIKDAVGRRGHTSRLSQNEFMEQDAGYLSPDAETPGAPHSGILDTPTPQIAKAFTWKNKPEEYRNGQPIKPRDRLERVSSSARSSQSPNNDSRTTVQSSIVPELRLEPAITETDAESWNAQMKDIRRELIANEPSLAGSANGDLEGPLLGAHRDPNSSEALLHRRQSISGAILPYEYSRHDAYWPRHMSFSEVEEAVLGWEEVGVLVDNIDVSDNWLAYRKQKLLENDYKHLYECMSTFQNGEARWVEGKVAGIEELHAQSTRDEDEFQRLYYQLGEAYQSVKQSSQDILAEERSHVTEAIKDIEVLGAKLEYEINALISKVEDADDGVDTFAAHVDELEAKADELEAQMRQEGWLHWAVRKVTGMGTHPYIGT